MNDRFRPHPKNPDIMVGRTYKFTDSKGMYRKPDWATTQERILEEKAKQLKHITLK